MRVIKAKLTIKQTLSLLFSSLLCITPIHAESDSFQRLKKELERYNFKVILQIPPYQGAYGLLNADSRTIWINPVVFDLNIANPTLIHEAVHAAQLCAGKGKMEALGLEIQPINQARLFFQRYTDINRQDLEREAYAVQTQPDNLELALSLLEKHCR